MSTENRDAPTSRRLAESVAAEIEAEIIRQGWPVGTVLGSETDLIARAGVSRAVFREAARIVEHHNVARMRRGPNGGLVVTAPDPRTVADAAALYLTYAGVEITDLFETRSALEIACAGRAAERITEDGITTLRQALAAEAAAGVASGSGHTPDIHIVIADISGNTVDKLFVQVLTQLTQVAAKDARSRLAPDEAFTSYHSAHVAIADAIVAGDVALAQHRMRRHLDTIEQVF